MVIFVSTSRVFLFELVVGVDHKMGPLVEYRLFIFHVNDEEEEAKDYISGCGVDVVFMFEHQSRNVAERDALVLRVLEDDEQHVQP